MIQKKTYLVHHGILGQKWGIRRYQNPDGSYTEAGKKRRNLYIEKELTRSDEKWDRRKRQATAKAMNAYTKGIKALEKNNVKRANKYDAKYVNAQKQYHYYDAMKHIEQERIKKMTLSDINKEKSRIGKQYVASLGLSAASIVVSSSVKAPFAFIYFPNKDNLKTDMSISKEEQLNIKK